MRLTADHDKLTAALKRLSGVSPGHTTIPILDCLLVTAGDDGLSLSATDLDMEMTWRLDADVEEPGSWAWPNGMLTRGAGAAGKGGLALLSVEDLPSLTRATMRIGRSRWTTQAMSADDWPRMTFGGEAHSAVIPSATLREMLSVCAPAISDDESRHYLKGVFLHALDGHLVAVSTDGHRLHRLVSDLPDGLAGMPGIIVPSGTVKVILPLIDLGDECAVRVSDTKIAFEVGPVRVVSSLIDDKFVDYVRVIPDRNDAIPPVTFDGAEMAAAVRAAIVACDDKTRVVSLAIDGSAIAVSARGSVIHRDAEAECACSYDGPPIALGLNGVYLLDMIAAMPGEALSMQIASASNPVLVTVPDRPDATGVIMPYRI